MTLRSSLFKSFICFAAGSPMNTVAKKNRTAIIWNGKRLSNVGLLSLKSDFTVGLGDGLTLLCAVGFAFQIFFTSQFVGKYREKTKSQIQTPSTK